MAALEAVVVSTAISTALKSVSNKLVPLVIKDYISILGVANDLRELHDVVLEIDSWLETRDENSMKIGQSFNWLKRLKGVTYDVDDLVDEFHMEAERHDAKVVNDNHDSQIKLRPVLLRSSVQKVLLRFKAAKKIKEIKQRFAEIVKQRTDIFAITNSLPFGAPVPSRNQATAVMPSLPDVDAASVFGRDKEKHHVISKLVETDDQQNIKIISIIGLGGSGKTTLAKLITNDTRIIEKHFDVRLWVYVSQDFNVQKLVEKLYDSFADSKSECHPLQYMIKKISEKLTKQRFLLVLDDVWTEDKIKWDEFIIHLRNGLQGSRILLTTRSRIVAEAVNSADIFNLPLLYEAACWQLFKQCYGPDTKYLDSNFLNVGKTIVENCGGIPLAIKVLAGILRGKKELGEWEALRDRNLLTIEDKEHRVSECLKLSYSNMPSHLKQCFTICSVFPKGYKIDKELLIDQWISHGMMSPVDGVDYLEYSGNLCFNSLVQMCFLQDVDAKDDGRVECSLHDLVHDLARSILDDEISIVVPQESASSTKTYRYFSLTEESRNIASKNVFEKARSIYVSAGDNFIFGKALKNARHLRSMTVKYVETKLLPRSILQVTNLRYLSISGLKFEALPEAISCIWSLQALRLNCPCLQELPNSIGKLKKLRTINLSGCSELMVLPDSIGDCHMISSLDFCYCLKLTTLPNSISKNKNLRVLRLGLTKIKRLPHGITELGNLKCLDLWFCRELVELPEGIHNLHKLQILNLDGCDGLKSIPAGIGHVTRLQKLGLFVLGEEENSAKISELVNVGMDDGVLSIRNIAHGMDKDGAYKACLQKKTNLQSLSLNWSTDWSEIDTEMVLEVLDSLKPPSGIKSLDIGRYAGEKFAWWMLKQIGGGIQGPHQFPCLTVMRLWYFPNLKSLSGLVELPCLVELDVSEMPCLESISGGPFPSLVKLVVRHLPSLEELWLVTERTLTSGKEKEMQIGTCLSYLQIEACNKLMVKPYLPCSLEHLELRRCNAQLLLAPGQGPSSSDATHDLGWEIAPSSSSSSSSSQPPHPRCGQEQGLKTLHIHDNCRLIELPESIRSLMSLQSLLINHSSIHLLPEWLGELQSLREINIFCCGNLNGLPQSIGNLTSLEELRIGSFELNIPFTLPEWIGQLHSLRILEINCFSGLWLLPKSLSQLTSLEELHIKSCVHLGHLGGLTKCLPGLKRLEISGCSELSRHLKKESNSYLTSHIPHLDIS